MVDCRGRNCLLAGLVLVGLLMSWEQSKRGGAEQVVLVHRRSPLGPVSDGGSPLAAPSPAPTTAAATRARLRSVPEPAARALLRTPPLAAEPPAWVEDHEPRTRALLRLFALLPADTSRGLGGVPAVGSLGGCPANCSGHGQCHAQRGGVAAAWAARCVCAPGWNGTACEVRDPSPCNTPQGGRVLSRCAGACDADVNKCLCGEGSRYPLRPMAWCYYDGVERDMAWQTPTWSGFAHGPKASFWGGTAAARGSSGGAQPWCDARPGERTRVQCKCYDGQRDDRLCEPVSAASTEAMFCLNQCRGRGECRAGFCRCFAPFYGADCSLSAAGGATLAAPAAPPSSLPPSRASKAGGGVDDGSGRPAAPLRPRIYVYELPGEFNTFLLARRHNTDACVLREYARVRGAGGGDAGTAREWSPTLYGAEVALHEELLASAHRTSDPAEADYFYVPSYGGCFISEFNKPYPKHWLCDGCHTGRPADLASLRSLRWHEALLRHLRTAYPYWNRSGGADHLWPFTHDEGACYAPAALRNATLLVHWGRTTPSPNGSSEYHLWRVKPWGREMYGWRRCYDPCKDVVLPSWRRPEDLRSSPYLHPHLASGGRPNLFYFNGALGRTDQLRNYSFGLRQQLFALYGGAAHAARGVVVTDVKTPRYGEMLSASKFCGVLPGWGWSGRMEDAVLHGCVPVILQDGIHTPWEGTLETAAYALRVPRAQMGSLLETLRAVSPARLAAMQAALARVWPRFAYLGLVVREHTRPRAAGVGGGGGGGPPVAQLEPLVARDATATLLQALRVRLLRRTARAARAASGGGGGADEIDAALSAAAGCEVTAGGGEVSVEDGDEPERGFENRVIFGWTV